MLKINSKLKTSNFDVDLLHKYFLENDIESFNKEISDSIQHIDDEKIITFEDIENNLDKYKGFIHFRLESENLKGYHLGLYSDEDERFYVICTFNWYTRKELKSKFDVKPIGIGSHYYKEDEKKFIEFEFDKDLLEDIKKEYLNKKK